MRLNLPALKGAAVLFVLANLAQYVQMATTGRASFGTFLLLQTGSNVALLLFCLYRAPRPVVIVPSLPELSSLGGDMLGDGQPRFSDQQALTALYVIATHMGGIAVQNPATEFRTIDGTDMRPVYAGSAIALLDRAKRQNKPTTAPNPRYYGE